MQYISESVRGAAQYLWESARSIYESVQISILNSNTPMETKIILHRACARTESMDVSLTKIQQILDSDKRSVHMTNYAQQTPLHVACQCNPPSLEVIAKLIQYGAHLNNWDAYGKTPLHYACENESATVPLMELLVNAGADVNYKYVNGTGNTPLHAACRVTEPSDSIIEYLIQKGADANKRNMFGDTPTDYLKCKDHVRTRDDYGNSIWYPIHDRCALGL